MTMKNSRSKSLKQTRSTALSCRSKCTKSFPREPPPEVKKLTNTILSGNRNRNNTSACAEARGSDVQHRAELPLPVLVRLIVIALQKISDPKGSSLKDIRRLLASVGVIEESTDLRQAMIVALKLGAVARPVWAVKAGLYGRYVQGDGIPIFAGRKSRPQKLRHRRSQWITAAEESRKRSAKKRKGGKKHTSKRSRRRDSNRPRRLQVQRRNRKARTCKRRKSA
ncbi:hypothetical protein EGW08_005731 [Elysia chlorotica]|uniref:H15 domain-containing protein n=1 Tax=Elysia chlorotica TaxID=188477 RepID=A0A433TY23_ELYCH|nr:hypothetical protein EGW08_005731 [Elysia chlorotica]